jgi:ParB family chromosome partitioning protein
MAKAKGLGRGLDALLGGSDSPSSGGTALAELPDDAALRELADSIKTQGVMQPILVRPLGAERYEIIAGERRWRAARMAGLPKVPAQIRAVADHDALAMALIENIQREDLNALEEAIGIQRLLDEFGMTHEAAAQALGRSRAAVTNLLRLLALASPVRELLQRGELDMGHARALLALSGAAQIDTARSVVARGLTVRETERLVAARLKGPPRTPASRIKDRDVLRLQEDLSQKLGTRVVIKLGRGGRGALLIEYSSLQHLDGLLRRIK